MTDDDTRPELGAELAGLRARLAEAEETLRAIGAGEADALVIAGTRGDEVQLLGPGDRIYRQFIETAGEGTATVSAGGMILSCNAGLAHTLRRPLDQLLGTAIRDHLSPEDHEICSAMLAHACPESSRRKISLKTSDGSLVPVYLSATLLYSAGAEPVCCLVFADLAEVISAEQALRRERDRAQSYLDTVETIIVALDARGRITLVNRKCCEIFGWSEGELLGRFWFAVCLPQPVGMETAYPYFLRLMAGGQEAAEYFENPIVAKSGELRQVAWHNALLHDDQGNIVGTLSSGEDITERTQAAKERERLTVAIEAAGEIVIVTDVEGTIQYVNPVFETVTGYGRAEVIGKSSRILRSHEHSAALYREALDAITAGRVWRGRLVNSRKDGTLLTVDSTISPVRDQAGRIVNFVGVERDVTEHLRLVEERSALEDQLRQAQKVEAIGRLAGGVAHDFNNLTAIVLGYGEMLLRQLRPEDPARKWAEQIVAAGKRSASLTRQLLAFSRKQVLLPVVLDLNGLLRNLEKMLGRLIGEDIELTLDLAGDLGRITADPGQIEQVVANLVLNARDAMPRGGRLTVETANVDLDEAFVRNHKDVVPGEYVRLDLTDTGCGMDAATIARLFEPFFTTKERGKGTGLGLATAFGIVKQSGGYLYVDSEPGKGATFTIYLPRTSAKPKAPAIETGDELPPGRGERILLVEDEEPLRELCATVLSRLGYRVSTAGSGPEALTLVGERGFEPDLVLTDVVMPGMSGAEMAERLRRDRPGLRVLYMSGYPDDAIAPHGVLGPGISLLPKPFSERVLAAKVCEALGCRDVAATRQGRRVLMIDDDEQFLELAGHFCRKRGHMFAGVASSAAALAALAGGSFDVLLVDLNIPGTSGERILREIRAAGHDAPAIVLTGDAASADSDALGPLGVVQVLEKSSAAEPLLRAIEAAATATRIGRGG